MKTIKAYLKLIRKIEKINPVNLKGYNGLSEKDKITLSVLSAEISNIINEIEE